jgi:PAS domain S-box-containing protein
MASVRSDTSVRSTSSSFPVVPPRILVGLAGWALIFGALHLAALYRYLLFHSLVDLFSVVVGCGLFLVAWNSRRLLENHYLLFLGIAYLFVAMVALVHVLSYKGMGVFPGFDANLPTQLWIAGRYLEALSLLAAPWFFTQRVRPGLTLAGYAGATALLLLVVFTGRFPDCFIEGQGLTAFKRGSEYVVAGLLALAIVPLVRHRAAFEPMVLRYVIGSILAAIAAGLAFTTYANVYAISNQIGHYLNLASSYLLYRALVETGLQRPYQLLFRELKQSEAALQTARDELELRVQERTAELGTAVTQLRAEIAERLRTEERLREAEEKYRGIFANAIEGIFQSSPEGRFLAANPALARMFGYASPEEMITSVGDIGRQLYQNPEDRAQFRARLEGEGFASGFEYEGRRKDGTRFWVSLSGRTVRDPEGRLLHYEGFAQDVTEHRRAHQTQARLASIVESSDDAIISQALDGTVLTWNRGAERIYGYAAEEMTGRRIEVLAPPERREELRGILETVGAGQLMENFESVRLRKDGRAIHVSLTFSPLRDATGRVSGVSTIARDITVQKQAAAEIQRLNEELEARVQARTAELQAANKDLEAFAYSASHDLRAPLRGIAVLSQVLLQDYGGELPAEAQRSLGLIQDRVKRMSQLIDDLLGFSRLGRQPVERRLVWPGELVKAAFEELALECQGRHIELALDELPPCEADPALLKQVFMNLLSNALKFTRRRETARIEVRALVVDKETIYQVRDNGVGFDPKHADRLFEVFRRVHRPQDYEGTGVGLALVHRIITRHGGRVWAEGTPDQGAAFSFTLGPGDARPE